MGRDYLIVVVMAFALTLCSILRALVECRLEVTKIRERGKVEVAKIKATSAGEVAKIKAIQQFLAATGHDNAISLGVQPEQIRRPPGEIEEPEAITAGR